MDENEEYIVTMMMEALDGELAEAGWTELESHLRVRPDLAREWQALQTIDALFRSTPALSPAADFTQRTIARLPNRRARLWFVSAIYVLLLFSGAIPLLAVGWILFQFGSVLLQPAFLGGLVQILSEGARLLGVITGALLTGAGELIGEQPAILGWLLVMAGMVFLWTGVYQQLVSPVSQRVRRN